MKYFIGINPEPLKIADPGAYYPDSYQMISASNQSGFLAGNKPVMVTMVDNAGALKDLGLKEDDDVQIIIPLRKGYDPKRGYMNTIPANQFVTILECIGAVKAANLKMNRDVILVQSQ